MPPLATLFRQRTPSLRVGILFAVGAVAVAICLAGAKLVWDDNQAIRAPLTRTFLKSSGEPTPTDASAVEEKAGDENGLASFAAAMNDRWALPYQRIAAARKILEFGSDEEVLNAIDVLKSLGNSDAISLLSALAGDPNWPGELRAAAINALGGIGTREAAEALLASRQAFYNPDLVSLALDVLKGLPSDDTTTLWRDILNDRKMPSEARTAAAEAMSHATADVLPNLKQVVATDSDPDVRAAAAWSMSVLGPEQPYGADLASIAATEPEADVRRRIYEALLTQANNPSADLLRTIDSETDTSARIAGLNALGDAVGRGAAPGTAATFDSESVPELTQIALSDGQTLNLRMRAVFALRRASTDAALAALVQITLADSPQVASAAQNGIASWH